MDFGFAQSTGGTEWNPTAAKSRTQVCLRSIYIFEMHLLKHPDIDSFKT
ncbi:hypothetical protein CKA32_002331 [Geitlerinema sp. FC II]|nr:hypothetical protein CKA32_002331 [Geitlerinema sp. FC II]